jgi:hypothetical protein
VSRQQPIFEYEDEAEAILSYLESIKTADLLRALLPTFICILFQEIEKECPAIEMIKVQIKRVSEEIKKVDWSDW